MRSIKLFSEMIKGPVRPNHFTFASVLKECGSTSIKLGFAGDNCVGNSLISMHSRSGHMKDAQRAFDALFEKDLISYNTLVDTCAKNMESDQAFEICNWNECGTIEAAFRVFCEMREKNIIAWTPMITGFTKHGFASRTLDTFCKMLEAGVRPNEITYVAVLSSCSYVGQSGGSWIQMTNIVHKFYVGDTSALEIYHEHDRLASRIRKLGYVLNTKFVLYDVGEGQKEQYLLQHHEKIGVIFGLVSTFSPKSVRVFKNLHICRDCHSVIKYISMATGDLYS
ncbi:hypothetical protein EUGRSUZ_K00442 [Eucalyptus grandis]|uniref:Uncharacterized protein n=2 Tax=Eucalyptus grandis TaxID=71139 RepID=A0ACC3IQ95_EUCGR|nr:hypothetical protein EUGRSUZ_K00442 [Eucalyptus grandis]